MKKNIIHCIILKFYSLTIALRITRFKIKKILHAARFALSVLYGSKNRQRLLPHTSLSDWFCITEVENIYCAVRTEPLYKTGTFGF